MGAMTSTQVLATELEAVDSRLPLLYDKEDTWFSFVAKRPAEVVSERDMRIPLEIRPGGKFGQFNPAGGDLGRGAGGTYEKAVITTIPFKYAKEWQLKTQWVTDSRRKSVVDAIKKEIAGAMTEFRRASDGIALQAGNGILATVSSVSTGSGVDTVVCDQEYGVRLLRFGQSVNVYSSDLQTNRTASGATEITYYDIPSRTIKFAAVSGITAGDVIVVEGVSGADPVSVYGLPYHASSASTGSWLTFSRADYPEVRANSVNAASGGLAIPHARLAKNKIGDRLGNDVQVKSVAWMHPCQKQAYEELGQLAVVINTNKGANSGLDMYFGDDMKLAGSPVKTHFSWSKKRIDFVSQEVWARAEMQAAKFLEIGGTRVFEVRGPSGGVAASMITYIVASWNMYVNKPPAISYIENLAIPDGY